MIPSLLKYALKNKAGDGYRLSITLNTEQRSLAISGEHDTVEITLDDIVWFSECIAEILNHTAYDMLYTEEVTEVDADGREA